VRSATAHHRSATTVSTILESRMPAINEGLTLFIFVYRNPIIMIPLDALLGFTTIGSLCCRQVLFHTVNMDNIIFEDPSKGLPCPERPFTYLASQMCVDSEKFYNTQVRIPSQSFGDWAPDTQRYEAHHTHSNHHSADKRSFPVWIASFLLQV
jgi:hypothetical protein